MALIVENKIITFFKKATNRIVPILLALIVILGTFLWFWVETRPSKEFRDLETRIEIIENIHREGE